MLIPGMRAPLPASNAPSVHGFLGHPTLSAPPMMSNRPVSAISAASPVVLSAPAQLKVPKKAVTSLVPASVLARRPPPPRPFVRPAALHRSHGDESAGD